jgi:hypothetical protein
MRLELLAFTAAGLTIAVAISNMTFPGWEKIEISEPLVVARPTDEKLCAKYSASVRKLSAQHTKCMEDLLSNPKLASQCEELSDRLEEHERLQGFFCYGDYEDGC